MRTIAVFSVAVVVVSAALAAQETKPVPKDSARVSIPGCTKGYIFTAGRRTVDEPGSVNIPEGLHLRMNGPKKLIGEIKAHEGAMIELTGLMKKEQYMPGGVAIGGGARISGGPPVTGSVAASPNVSQSMIDVEGWRPIEGSCPSR